MVGSNAGSGRVATGGVGGRCSVFVVCAWVASVVSGVSVVSELVGLTVAFGNVVVRDNSAGSGPGPRKYEIEQGPLVVASFDSRVRKKCVVVIEAIAWVLSDRW